jgi:hypothetical protein
VPVPQVSWRRVTGTVARRKQSRCYDPDVVLVIGVGIVVAVCLAALGFTVGLRALRGFVRSLWPH